MKSNVATQININNPDKIIDKMQIFLNFSGSFKSGGKKYIYEIPAKEPILERPKINVLLNPSPSIGNIFWNEKLFKFPINRSNMLTKITGNIKAVVFIVELNPKLLEIPMAIININIM